MVERQASTTCLGPARTVVPHPKSPAPFETIPSKMASSGTSLPSPMPQPTLQDFKMVLIKHAAVLDQLCNHKQAIAD